MSKKNAFITPDFFSVARELIGLPLSSPARRAGAMAIDGMLVALLTQAGGVFLGLAAVFVLLRASRRSEKTGYVRAYVRFPLRAIAAIVLFVVVMQAWDFGEGKINEQMHAEDTQQDTAGIGNLNLTFPPGEGLSTAANLAGLATADEPSEVSTYARKVLEAAKRAGATDRQLRDVRPELIKMLGDDSTTANVAALDSVLIAVVGQAPVTADSPVSREDSLNAVIADLRQDVQRLDQRGDKLATELEEAREKRGVRTYLSGIFDDLGLGFGWAAVYFTAFLAMMRGQTPGKKLLGIRVIRLDGKPLGWWIAFERFGGYAASFS
ncbi:MAG TPA: RDD family protein, partial [Longimicrobiales bacterium]